MPLIAVFEKRSGHFYAHFLGISRPLLDPRDGLMYKINTRSRPYTGGSVKKNDVIIIDTRHGNETVAVFRMKFLMPIYYCFDKLGEVEFLQHYFLQFKKMFQFKSETVEQRSMQAFAKQFQIIKTRPQGEARRRLIRHVHQASDEVDNID